MGQIVAVMSVDAQKIQDFFTYSSLVWSVPVTIIGSTYLLWMEVGPAAFAGLAVLFLVIPLNALFLARKAMKLQGVQMKQKDKRFKLLNEIFSGIKVSMTT